MSHVEFEQLEQPILTPKEAEDVIALWQRRVRQSHTMPTASVREIAEVLNARPEEVIGLLDEVRTKPKGRAGLKTLLQSLKWLFIGLIGIGVMAGLFGAGYSIGARQRFGGVHGIDYARYGPMVSPPGQFSVGFDGYALTGDGNTYVSATEQDRLEQALMGAVRQMLPEEMSVSNSSTGDARARFRAALEDGREIPGQLKYKQAWVSNGPRKVTSKLPVSLSTDYYLRSLVEEYRNRAIKRLTSSIFLPQGSTPRAPK